MNACIEVQRYTDKDRAEWESFLQRCNNATMFHRQAFLDYHAPDKFEFHHLLFRDRGKLVAVMPGGFFPGRPGQYWSPVGASYGGFVAPDLPFETCLRIVDAFLDYARQQQWTDAFIIPPPIIYARELNQHFEYAMLYRRFGFELHYISHVVPLTRGPDFLNYFDKTARKSIRKILRHGLLRVEESDDYATFYDILVENKARHGARPTHTLEELERLRRLVPEHLRLLMVYADSIPVAGSLLFLTNANVVLCFYNMLRYQYEHLRPIYLLMYEIIRRAYAEGYRWVDIGVSQDTKSPDPMTPSLSLIAFKERFDARGVLRTTFHYRFLRS
ncbi:MAG: GNAT family N-acetyltransferase [Bacteroidota bacterium]|nr:GNAT family N-acetyltransferase [Bacteroidota bacterium]